MLRLTAAGFVTFLVSLVAQAKETGADACDSGNCPWLAQCNDVLGSIDCSDCKPGAVHASLVGSSKLDCVNDGNLVCDTAPWTTPRLVNACHDEDDCPWGYEWSDESRSCVDVDECEEGTHECGDIARCANVPGIYVCVCPKLQDHYVGTFTGRYRFSRTLKSCIDDSADPVCTYPQFRYNGTCVSDACADTWCGDNEMCMTSVDGKTAECACMGELDEDDNCTAPFE
ncbi:hypothetical protein CHLRE_11g467615v5 [Chlamydomonas reinhardtii]|uniref:EGF-like domain-containing protein n=1 Tax=Chlamydomonas reinhardtii TaxID=3055 RepID=A0A2K3D7F9_CHLRE|nr:uncharacterized protein CHLRE_11g467615v5 [Chlamydomonas reinhardtii]PNW76468.1 hypothetical protein CHLRE_11g467615v5 [Chlamydomonas reinhardtii]